MIIYIVILFYKNKMMNESPHHNSERKIHERLSINANIYISISKYKRIYKLNLFVFDVYKKNHLYMQQDDESCAQAKKC